MKKAFTLKTLFFIKQEEIKLAELRARVEAQERKIIVKPRLTLPMKGTAHGI